jgi:hypothetical protein
MLYSAHAQAFGPDDEVLSIDDDDVVDLEDEPSNEDEEEAPFSVLDYEKLHDDGC